MHNGDVVLVGGFALPMVEAADFVEDLLAHSTQLHEKGGGEGDSGRQPA